MYTKCYLMYILQRHIGYLILLCNFIEHTLDHHTQESLFIFREFPSIDVAQGLIGKTKNRTFPKFHFLFPINTDYVDICIFVFVTNVLTVSERHEINTKLEIIELCASFPLSCSLSCLNVL